MKIWFQVRDDGSEAFFSHEPKSVIATECDRRGGYDYVTTSNPSDPPNGARWRKFRETKTKIEWRRPVMTDAISEMIDRLFAGEATAADQAEVADLLMRKRDPK